MSMLTDIGKKFVGPPTLVSVALCLCSVGLVRGREEPTPDNQLGEVWNHILDTGAFEDGVKRLEALAAHHQANQDFAVEVHLRTIECHERRGDLTAAVEKARWLREAFPKARIRQYSPLGDTPTTMAEEWHEYVQAHPIYIKDYMWFKLADLYRKSGRREDALAAYDHVLAGLAPEPIPNTKNSAILHSFRLHKASLDEKIRLLVEMRLLDEAEVARHLREKLYPPQEWLRVRQEADEAYDSYVRASAESVARERAAQLERAREHEEAARLQREAAENAREQREKEIRERDEKRRQLYLNRKARRSAGEEPARGQPESRGAQAVPSLPSEAKRPGTPPAASTASEPTKEVSLAPHKPGTAKPPDKASRDDDGPRMIHGAPLVPPSTQPPPGTPKEAVSNSRRWLTVSLIAGAGILLSLSAFAWSRLRKRRWSG